MIGELIDGKYLLTDRLGTGSTGEVFLARHQKLDRHFAIKLLFPSLSGEVAFSGRFRREGKALARLDHPNIVRVFDASALPDGRLYLVMENVSGIRLDEQLRRTGSLELPRALKITRQLADALEHAQLCGVLHRDLRPANLMLVAPDTAAEHIKVLDFGIAKIDAPNHRESIIVSKEYAGVGVFPHYKAPEQLRFKPVDGRADLYALGCIFYELLTGRRPFEGASADIIRGHLNDEPLPPSARRPALAIAAEIDELILKCLAKDPAARFQKPAELIAALKDISGGAKKGRRVLVPEESDPALLSAAERDRDRRQSAIDLARLLLTKDDENRLFVSVILAHDLELQHDELQRRLEWARQHAALSRHACAAREDSYRGAYDHLLSRNPPGAGDDAAREVFAEGLNKLRAEIARDTATSEETVAALEARCSDVQIEIARQYGTVEDWIERLLPGARPSGELFLATRRWKQSRT